MNKSELKKVLKPLIKECIKEVLFEEDGALSHVIKEVAVGLVEKQQINETNVRPPRPRKRNDQQLKQRKKKLLDAIGKDAYGGVNVFEGTTPAPAVTNEGQARGPLADVAPSDPGVDISGLFGAKAFAMSQRLMENK
tara:strand:- start:34 stop:444 length:411 start_codon:yes stop_codon:yes gene_type:complete